jgi:pimeloyl-ACP methyl ester carboxylesterase
VAPALTERFVTLGGSRHLVRESGTGTPVLLLHGMWCESGMWLPVLERLAPSHRVVAPDFRAHGGTAVPAPGWSIADLADDMVSLLDKLDIPVAAVAGFSMGGMAALHMALRYPKRVSSLALIGTSAGAEEMVRVAQIRGLDQVIRAVGFRDWMVRESARATFSSRFRRAKPAAVTRWSAAVRAMTSPALRQGLDAVASRPSLVDELPRIRVPATIVTGTADRVLRPRWSLVMRDHLPVATLVIQRGAGHAVPIERPSETAAVIAGLAS